MSLPPVPQFWIVTHSVFVTHNDSLLICKSLEDQGFYVWPYTDRRYSINLHNRFKIAHTQESALSMWVLTNSDLIQKHAVKCYVYNHNERRSRRELKELRQRSWLTPDQFRVTNNV